MLFNSLPFATFFLLFFAFYWSLGRAPVRWQNLLVVAGSYYFYAQWDWRFLSLVVASTVIDYFVSLLIASSTSPGRRKFLLLVSIIANLGMLGVFKYSGFFVDSWIEMWSGIGFDMSPRTWKIVLPVGISFYTFQTLSYTIDTYRRTIEPSRDFVAYAAYVSFFPQLVAGPIERATQLLPQFLKERSFDPDLAIDGFRQFVWGFFKKVAVADTCGMYADVIFDRADTQPGSVLVLGVVYFAFQIYGDFSGYSDMAIGASKMLGIRLMTNFRYPYFSRDIAEFWRRWHISLSTWFRDYVYIPLGGSRRGRTRNFFNVLLVFLVSGFWHGANWTFLVWGLLHAVYFVPLMALQRNRDNLGELAPGRILPSLRDLLGIGLTFVLTCIAWVFFRADSLAAAIDYLQTIASPSLLSLPLKSLPVLESYAFEGIVVIALLVPIEWIKRSHDHPLQGKGANVLLVTAFVLIALFGVFTKRSEFIYFQF